MAEEKIGALLDGLAENYAVRHDVNTGQGHIDHLCSAGTARCS